mgnify:FL=1
MNKNLKVILATLVTICVVGTLAFSDINGSYAIDSSYLEQYLCPAVDNIIHYDTNGGNKIDDTKVPVNYRPRHITGAELPTPTKKGLFFMGWYYDKSLTKKVEGNSIYDVKIDSGKDSKGCDIGGQEITLYANWGRMCAVSKCIKLKRAITFYTNGGSKIEKTTVDISDKTIHKIPETTKEGSVFMGWYYDEALTNKVETSYLEELKYIEKYDEYGCPIETSCDTLDINIYAKWSEEIGCVVPKCMKEKNVVTFNTNGGSKIEKTTVDLIKKLGEEYTPHKIPEPTKSGYTFAGWYFDSGLTKKVDVTYLEDLVHKTKYDERGCPIITCDDATFELYAKWAKKETTKTCNTKVNNKYTLTYQVSNGQNVTKEICVGCNDNPTLINLERNGYAFAGWYYDSALTKKVEAENTGDIKVSKKYDKSNCHIGYKNVTLYPKWIEKNVCKEEKTLTVSFDTLGGSNIDDIKITSKEFTVFKIDPEIPTKENYTFVGWYYDSGLTNKVDTTALTLNTNNTNCEDVQITLYAKYASVDTAILKGKIYNSNNAVLAYAKISLDDKLETISDNTGNYEFENVSDGNHELIIKDINDNIITKTNLTILNQSVEPEDSYTLTYTKNENIIDVDIKIDKSGNVEFVKNNSKDINSLLLVLGLLIIVVVAVIISKNSNNKPNESEELDAE